MQATGYQANANAQTVKFAKLNQTLGQVSQLLSLLTPNLILISRCYLDNERLMD